MEEAVTDANETAINPNKIADSREPVESAEDPTREPRVNAENPAQ